MVILNLKGGIGNQLFQFIAALNFALKNESKLYIYSGNMSSYSTPREFSLDLFIRNSPVELIVIERKVFLLERHILAALKLFKLIIITEENILDKKKSLINVIDDYFIKSKFLDDNILNFLKQSLDNKFYYNISLKVPDFLDKDILGVHIRGTDRVSENIDVNYGDIIKNIVLASNIKIYCFTDDIDFARLKLRDVSVLIIYVTEFNFSDLEEFYFISKISKFIVSNSTFSILARRMTSFETSTYVIKDLFANRDRDLLEIMNFNSSIYFV
jgi:hypothetical protein